MSKQKISKEFELDVNVKMLKSLKGELNSIKSAEEVANRLAGIVGMLIAVQSSIKTLQSTGSLDAVWKYVKMANDIAVEIGKIKPIKNIPQMPDDVVNDPEYKRARRTAKDRIKRQQKISERMPEGARFTPEVFDETSFRQKFFDTKIKNISNSLNKQMDAVMENKEVERLAEVFVHATSSGAGSEQSKNAKKNKNIELAEKEFERQRKIDEQEAKQRADREFRQSKQIELIDVAKQAKLNASSSYRVSGKSMSQLQADRDDIVLRRSAEALELKKLKLIALNAVDQKSFEIAKQEYQVSLKHIESMNKEVESIDKEKQAQINANKEKEKSRREAERQENIDRKNNEAERKKADAEKKKQESESVASEKRRSKEESERIKNSTSKKNISDIMSSITSGGKISSKDLEFKIRQINSELGKMSKNVRGVNAKKIADDLDRAGVGTRIINDRLEITKVSSRHVESNFARTVRDMFSMEKLMSRISFVITAKMSYEAFDTVVRGIKYAIGANLQFRDEMSKTFAIMRGQMGDSDVEIENYKKKMESRVLDLAKKYRIATNEASDAIYEIISAQIDASKSMFVLEAAMKVAVGGFSDLKDATLSIVQILNAFDLEAERAGHVADVMFETTRLGIITTQQYADQMSKVASTASIFGISIEEISAAISTMTRNGVKVDQAFTSLNQLLMTIANPTKESEKLMSKYGKSMSIAEVRAKGLVNTLLDLQPLLTNEEDATTIFKTRTGFKAMASLVQNADEYGSDLLSIYDSVGAAQEAANIRLETTASLFEKAKSTAINFAISIGQYLEPTVRTIFTVLNSTLVFAIKNLWVLTSAVKGMAVAFVALRVVPAIMAKILLLSKLMSKEARTASWNKLLGGIPKLIGAIRLSMQATAVSARTAGMALKTAWAEATLGLSVLIMAVVELFGWIGKLAKKARESKIDKAMGVEGVDSKLEAINKQIELIDSNLSEIEGLQKLASQADEAYKSLDEVTKQSEKFKESQQNIANAIGDVIGKTIDYTVAAGNMSQYNTELHNKWMDEMSRKQNSILVLQQLEASKSIAESLKIIEGNKPGGAFVEHPAKEQYVKTVSKFENLMSQIKTITINSRPEDVEKLRKQIESFDETQVDMMNLSSKSKSNDRGHSSGTKYRRIKSKESVRAEELMKSGKNQGLLYLNSVATAILQKDIDSIPVKDFEYTEIDYDKNGGGREPQNLVQQIIDKYSDLFRRVGIEIDTTFNDALDGIKSDIEKAIAKGDIVPPETTTAILNGISSTLDGFAKFDDILKRKNESVSDVRKNLNDLTNQEERNESLTDSVEKSASKLKTLSDPYLKNLGENLVKLYTDGLKSRKEAIDAYLESEYDKLLSGAKTDVEKQAISQMILELDTDMLNKVMESSAYQLEKLIKEDDTIKKSELPAINKILEGKNKLLVSAMKAMFGKYSEFMNDIEDNMDSVSSMFDYAQKSMEKFGLKPELFEKLLTSVATGQPAMADEVRKALSGNKDNKDNLDFLTRTKNVMLLKQVRLIADSELAKSKGDVLAQSTADSELEELKKQLADVTDAITSGDGGMAVTVIETLLRDQLARDGYFEMTSDAKRRYRNNITGKPWEKAGGSMSAMTGADLWEMLKEKLDVGDAMSIGEAFESAESKTIEVVSNAWSTYWQNRIKEAEDAKKELLDIETSRQSAMLANENLSAEQKEALQIRFEERRKKIEDEQNKLIASRRKQQAMRELEVEFAKSIAMIWARELASKGFPAGLLTAGLLTAYLSGVFAIQRNAIDKASFAEGGYTGSGYGKPDKSGYKRAGVVHEGEIVIDKKTVDRNYPEIMNMYSSLKSGQDFDKFVYSYLAGKRMPMLARNNTGSFASGGFAGKSALDDIKVFVDMGNIRVMDEVDMNIMVERGGRKRRVIRG